MRYIDIQESKPRILNTLDVNDVLLLGNKENILSALNQEFDNLTLLSGDIKETKKERLKFILNYLKEQNKIHNVYYTVSINRLNNV